MKARILNNEFQGVYTDDFILNNLDNLINGQLVSEWQLTEILPSMELKKPIWNNSEWIEGAMPQEIAEQTQAEQLRKETEMYKKRTLDGINAYAEISAEFRLAKLSGILTEEQHVEIESILIPVRSEVLAGQWISARQKLEGIEVVIGVQLYNRLHTQISNYINENY